MNLQAERNRTIKNTQARAHVSAPSLPPRKSGTRPPKQESQWTWVQSDCPSRIEVRNMRLQFLQIVVFYSLGIWPFRSLNHSSYPGSSVEMPEERVRRSFSKRFGWDVFRLPMDTLLLVSSPVVEVHPASGDRQTGRGRDLRISAIMPSGYDVVRRVPELVL